MNDLEGRLCLITGGTKGIGRATVELFASCKARVFTCSRNKDDLDELLSGCAAQGWEVQGCVCDVQDKAALERMVDKVKLCFKGKLNVLVNNAAVLIKKNIFEFTDEEYRSIMTTNVESVYHLCKMCYPLMKVSNDCTIVNIGSISGGPRPGAARVPYIVSKGALHQLSTCLANEWAGCKIRVNCVAPGSVATPMGEKLLDDEYMKQWKNECLLKRVGKPEEVAKAVKFFSCNDSSFITGQVLYVDGGYSVRGIGY